MKQGILYLHIGEDSKCLQVINGSLTGLLDAQEANDLQLYIGRVTSINKELNACFLDIGQDKPAFMPLYKGHNLRCGQSFLVSCTKLPRDSKGAQVTDRVTIPGQFLCLLPGDKAVGVSTKITDAAERETLICQGRAVLEAIGPGFGVIMRTMSQGLSLESLIEEARYLADLYNTAREQMEKSAKPGLVSVDQNFANNVLKKLFTSEITEIIVDNTQVFRLLSESIPKELMGKVSLRMFDSHYDMLEYYNLNSLIRHSFGHKVLLPSGGSIVIDKTEAMTVIDVNSGKASTNKDMALTINLEAVNEIASQMRLRNMGGIIVVDFINMSKEQETIVLEGLRQAVALDRAVTGVYGFSALGLVEIARSRIRK